MAIGIMHVLPHATEAQATLGLHNNFPLAGLMVVVGFLLIFYVDREYPCVALVPLWALSPPVPCAQRVSDQRFHAGIVSPRHLCLGNRAKIPHNSQAHGSVAPRLGCDDEEQQGAKDTASISTASNGELELTDVDSTAISFSQLQWVVKRSYNMATSRTSSEASSAFEGPL